MTDAELQAEYEYRYQERLGILCESKEPTDEQKKLAKKEAMKWLRENATED